LKIKLSAVSLIH